MFTQPPQVKRRSGANYRAWERRCSGPTIGSPTPKYKRASSASSSASWSGTATRSDTSPSPSR
ncbi:hypothetical protein DMJ13_13005 [halophilic archaeon]|nr:hypothetical protein DMJ13_13005 [halophilic archaeon]